MMCEEALTHIGMADMVKVSEKEVSLLTGLEPVDAGADDAAAREGSQGDRRDAGRRRLLLHNLSCDDICSRHSRKLLDSMCSGDSFMGSMLFKLAERQRLRLKQF
jgi:sugar/nucleoside kinase (ribokinase family)